jgi:DNA polymerase elongation subunit (family B)
MTLHVSPYDVTVVDKVLNEETNEEHVNINLWCLDRESKPWLIRVNDFPAFCYIELPSVIQGRHFQWDELQASKVFNFIKRVLGESAPYSYQYSMKQKLYYFQGDRKYPMMQLCFKTLDAMTHCRNKFSKPVNIYGFGTVVLNVYETQVDIVRKLFTVRDLSFCTWLKVIGKEIPFDSDLRITTKGTVEKPMREMIVSYANITQEKSKESENWFTFPRILAFDIETYSDNHKAMPDDLNVKHVCNIISCIYYEVGKIESRKKYVFVLGDSEPVEGAEVICVKTEVELIDSFSQLIIDLDPEIISGYNIFAYDYRYLDNRLKTKMRDWPAMGRLLDKQSTMSTMKWKSGAYGYNIINILQMEGRISIDMLPIVKRDYRLDKYSLDFVSKTFLGRTKHDVKPVDMFKAYEHQTYIYEQMRKFIQEKTGKFLPNWQLLDEVKKFDNPVLLQRYELAKKEITRIVAYCIQDSDLVVDLFDKLNVWLGLNALSSVVGVPIIQLFTRGQQIRCLSQVYDKCYKKDVVLDKRIKDKVFYNGGFVFEPKPGLYDGVVCLDFASLYPSIMRAYNICFTTLVSPELQDKIPDEYAETIEVEQEEPTSGASYIPSGDGEANDFFNADEPDDGVDLEKTKTVFRTYKYKWVKKSVRYGILPEIQDHLVGSRNLIKKELASLEDEEETCTDPKRLSEIKLLLVLKDKYSNALKVSANSLYGFLGAQEGGVLSLIEAAMCITATGRKLIGQVNTFIETKYNGDVVYGDSVTPETPVLIRKNKCDTDIHWMAIEDVCEKWKNYDGRKDKEVIMDTEFPEFLEVWSDKGFTPIKRIIRHKTKKEIFEVKTQSGMIRCTADHSLLKKNGDAIRPTELTIGQELLHSDLPLLQQLDYADEDEIKSLAYAFCYKRKLNNKIMNVDNYTKKDFLDIIAKNKNFYFEYDVESAKFYHLVSSFALSQVHNHKSKLNKIVKIESLGTIDDYVYDFETENHHFSAGIGRMVVHNTDSSMVDLHIPDFKEAYAMGLRLAEEISGTPEKKLPDGTIVPAKPGLFPPPLKIEFEKCLRILCIKKKKYAGLFIGRDGEFVREKNKDGSLGDLKILKRGIIVARRDTAKIVHKTYNKLLKMILTREPMTKSYNLIMNTVEDLVNDRLSARENLAVIRSLSDKYKSDSYFMKVFGDELTRVGKPPNPSDRLEYVIVKTEAEEQGEKDVKLGLKMRLIEMYEDSWGIGTKEEAKADIDASLLLGPDDPLRNKEDTTVIYPKEKIDYEYYIGHIMQSPIDQLFSIGYMKELEKFKAVCYTPQFCRMKPVSILEPIQLVVRILEDYSRKGYKIDQTKELITQAKEQYGKILEL